MYITRPFKNLRIFILAVCVLSALNVFAQTDSALLVSAVTNGRDMVNWFLPKNTTIARDYPTACSYYGVCIFSEAIKDTSYLNTTATRYRALGPNFGGTGNVDSNVHGILPLELYRQTGDAAFRANGKRLADDEFSSAHLRSDTLSTYSRFWVDDMYMIGALQTQAYKNYIDTVRYCNNAARTLYRYIDSLQQPNGLFYHVNMPSLRATYYWGRGNGWAASAMTELLLIMPLNHPRRAYIFDAYVQQMQALVRSQDGAGLWHQLLDDTTTFKESSCTAMFVFALATGVQQGWLAADSFRVAAKQGWMALASCFSPDSGLRYVCTGLGASATRTVYTQHAQATGDSHGTAGFIWAATAMVRLLSSPSVRVIHNSFTRGTVPMRNIRTDTRLFNLQGRYIGNMENTGIMDGGSLVGRGIYIRGDAVSSLWLSGQARP